MPLLSRDSAAFGGSRGGICIVVVVIMPTFAEAAIIAAGFTSLRAVGEPIKADSTLILGGLEINSTSSNECARGRFFSRLSPPEFFSSGSDGRKGFLFALTEEVFPLSLSIPATEIEDLSSIEVKSMITSEAAASVSRLVKLSPRPPEKIDSSVF